MAKIVLNNKNYKERSYEDITKELDDIKAQYDNILSLDQKDFLSDDVTTRLKYLHKRMLEIAKEL